MSFPIFPPDYTLTYLAEGAANIVYRIEAPPSSPGTLSTSDGLSESYGPSTPPPTDLPPLATDTLYANKLLRLRKALPNLTSVFSAQESFGKHIAPLLPSESTVEQILVKLSNSLVSKCNAGLQQMESQGTRLPKRRGTYLADEEYGNLVTDMSSAGYVDVLTLEFKPKWLAQSPSAPTNARRCRTCAIQLKRRHAEGNETVSKEKLYATLGFFCPLRLVTSRSEDHAAVVEQVVSSAKGVVNHHRDAEKRLARWVVQTPLLRKLRNLQVELDTEGVLAARAGASEAEEEKLAVAMTLRDCTLFLKTPTAYDGPVEARLGDLDVKSEAKLEAWAAVEKALIDGGWYTNDVPGTESLGPCVLEDL